jgi:hypothetical protein
MPNPIPDDVVSIQNSDGAVVDSNSSGIDWSRGMNGFEMQTWMTGVFNEQTIRVPRLFSNIGG